MRANLQGGQRWARSAGGAVVALVALLAAGLPGWARWGAGLMGAAYVVVGLAGY